MIARARDSESADGTRIPVRPSSTSSGAPPPKQRSPGVQMLPLRGASARTCPWCSQSRRRRRSRRQPPAPRHTARLGRRPRRERLPRARAAPGHRRRSRGARREASARPARTPRGARRVASRARGARRTRAEARRRPEVTADHRDAEELRHGQATGTDRSGRGDVNKVRLLLLDERKRSRGRRKPQLDALVAREGEVELRRDVDDAVPAVALSRHHDGERKLGRRGHIGERAHRARDAVRLLEGVGEDEHTGSGDALASPKKAASISRRPARAPAR
jgi:hypothetical protein